LLTLDGPIVSLATAGVFAHVIHRPRGFGARLARIDLRQRQVIAERPLDHADIFPMITRTALCPFLALFEQPKTAQVGSATPLADRRFRQCLWAQTLDFERRYKARQDAAKPVFFALLTGGLRLRAQPEEPI
jgi:hypothetical protein